MITPHSSRLLNILDNILRFPSVTGQQTDVLKSIATYLETLGFRCQHFTYSEPDLPDVHNLYAIYQNQRPILGFCGHTDVVPAGDSSLWLFDAFTPTIHEEHLYARGVEDMKGAIACWLSAVTTFLEENPSFPYGLAVILTDDEEGPAVNGIRKLIPDLIKHDLVPDHCLIGEPTSLNCVGDFGRIGRRGSLTGYLTVTAPQGHSSKPFKETAINSVILLVRALLEHNLDDRTCPNFQPSSLAMTNLWSDYQACNVIPGLAKAQFNIRFNTLHTSESLKERIHNLLKATDSTIDFTLSWNSHPAEAFQTTPSLLTEAIDQACLKVNGQTTQWNTNGGTSDARFISCICPTAELGLRNRTLHKINENTPLADLERLENIYLHTLRTYFNL